MKKRTIIPGIIAFLILSSFCLQSFAQEEEQQEVISPYIMFSYLKNTDNQRILEARIFNATDIGEFALPGLPVKFYSNMEEPEVIGESLTDEKGIASLILPDDIELPVDEDQNWWFYAEFEGNDQVEMTYEEITVMDVMLEMTLDTDEEGSNSILLEAYTVVDGERIPVSDEDVYVYVPRMFSMLMVGESYLEDGSATIDFPDDLPGDPEGNLTVIGRFHDHWQFGNVEKREETSWGVPAANEVVEEYRALWTQIAPKWMIITLSVLLAGVWGHYMFAVFSLVRINRLDRKRENNAE